MTGLLVGLLFGAGVLCVVVAWRASAPPPPLIAALQTLPGHRPETPTGGSLAALLRPVLDAVSRLFGGRRAIQRRLELAGDTATAEHFLLRQVIWAAALAAAALAWLTATGTLARVGASVLLVLLAAAAGLLVGDYLLSRRIARRRTAIADQFPVAAQLLALLMASGAQPSEAIERVGAAIGGPLGGLFAAAADRVHAGQGFAASMRQLADAADHSEIERFVSGLVSAVERGSPLSELMRAQALDAAAQSHRHLMTEAGRRDIAMLVPVVFAVLPTVVLVVLLPGAVQLGIVGS